MSNHKKKSSKDYWAHELGLPVLIKDAPVIEIEGEEVVDLDYKIISEVLFIGLIMKPMPLTGAEVRFMRLFMEFTLEGLAEKLQVKHPTVLNWENRGNESTSMTPSTEAILRMLAAKEGAKDSELVEVVLNNFFNKKQQDVPKNKITPIMQFNPLNSNESPSLKFSDEDDLPFIQEA